MKSVKTIPEENRITRIHPLLQTSLEISRAPSNELLWNLTRHGGKFLEEIYRHDGVNPEWFGTERGIIQYDVTSRCGVFGKRRTRYGSYRVHSEK